MKSQITNSKSQTNLTGNKGGQATSMEELMKKSATKLTPLKKGENIEGTITLLTPQEIKVDLGGKAEAIVLEKDRKLLKTLLQTLHVGDSVTVSVLNPESDLGYPIVSLRRHLDEGVWNKLAAIQKENKKIEVTILEITRGGFLVETKDGLSGFLPNSHTSFVQNSTDLIGKTVEVMLLEVNRLGKKVIFSQKATTTDEEFKNITKQLKINEKIETTISNITSFGIFTVVTVVDGKVVDGFIHNSEISWEAKTEAEADYQAGEKIEALIISLDKVAKRVNLSIKRLSEDPFGKQTSQLSKDQKLSGKIVDIVNGQITIDLSSVATGVMGIIPKEKVPVGASYEIGQSIQVTISEIDTKRRRVLVSPVLLRKTIGYR